MNWYKRANLYESPNYQSDLEREYVELKNAYERLVSAYRTRPSPTAKKQIMDMQFQIQQMRMWLTMQNKRTQEQHMEGIRNQPYQLAETA